MNIRRHAAGIALTAMVAGGALTGAGIAQAGTANAATVTQAASHHHHHLTSAQILRILTGGYQRIHHQHTLFRFYVRHGAVAFLLSGVTSESPQTAAQAIALLHWLTANHVAPVDW